MSHPPEIDYSKNPRSSPWYRFNRITQQSGSTDVPLSTNGGETTIFELPICVANLAKSYLTYNVTPDANDVADRWNWAFKDCLTHIREISLYTQSGRKLAEIQEVANYTKVVWKAELKLEEYLDYERFGHEFGYGRMIMPNSADKSPIEITGITQTDASSDVGVTIAYRTNSFRPETIYNPPIKGAAVDRNYFGTFATASFADVSHLETAYIEPDIAAETGEGPEYNVQIPLGILLNSLFSVDKDIPITEILQLRIIWNSTNKMFFTSLSVAADDPDPAIDGQLSPGSTPLSYNKGADIFDLYLYLAVEQNEIITSDLMTLAGTKGFSMMIPYVRTYKTPFSASPSQNISLRFNRGDGQKLLKIYHACFAGAEQANLTYDLNNTNEAKVISFTTRLDNRRLQDFIITSANANDWLILKDKLKGSLIVDHSVYKYNYFWLDDFSDMCPPSEKPCPIPEDNFIRGIDLNQERKWDIEMTTAIVALAHYDFAITQKLLTINSAGIDVN